MRAILHLSLALGALYLTGAPAQSPSQAQAQSQASYKFDLPAQPLADALRAIARQTGANVLFESKDLQGVRAPALQAQLTATEAIQRVLAGTKLAAEQTTPTTVVVQPATQQGSADREQVDSQLRVAQVETAEPSREVPPAREVSPGASVPEILVEGSRVLNMDIARSRDDAQPYVIFDRATLDRSGAANLEDFLKTRLTMNNVSRTNSQMPGIGGNISQVDLRGLGSNQTLILVDGHRVASANLAGTPSQPDINGIPLAAIERIEILPSTASGIYGGSATGGVINIVMRRDYAGLDAKVTYANTFDSDVSRRQVDLSGGFSLEQGKTTVLLAGQYADQNNLTVRDRDFVRRYRNLLLQNNPNALYALTTPPLGATPNIRSATGTNLSFKGSTTTLGSPITFIPYGYSGTATDNGAALAANAGRYNLDLADSAASDGALRSVVNGPVTESAMFTLRRSFTGSVQAFLEGSFARNEGAFVMPATSTSSFTIPSSAPNNPFNQNIRVSVPITPTSVTNNTMEDRRVVGGVIVRLPRNWSAEADYTWNEGRFSVFEAGSLSSAAAPAIANGTFDVLRDLAAHPLDFSPYFRTNPLEGGIVILDPPKSTLKDATLRLSGPVARLPGGKITVSALLEQRRELFGSLQYYTGGVAYFTPARSQGVDSMYLETKIPFVSARNSVPGVQALELQLAGRYDDYRVEGTNDFMSSPSDPDNRVTNRDSSMNPTLGLRYQPLRDAVLRASYGTGFLPPAVNQLAHLTPYFFDATSQNLTDPRRGNEPVTGFEYICCGNANLRPEKSESWSAGIVLTPRFIEGLRLSVDWTRIDKTDNLSDLITAVGSYQGIVNQEDVFPGRVIRAASTGSVPGPIVAMDVGLTNLSRAEVEAYDVALDFRQETARYGAFDWFAMFTRQTHYKTQVLPGDSVSENVGLNRAAQYTFPLSFKGNAGVSWTRGAWNLGWNAHYFASYRLDDVYAAFGPQYDFIRSQGSATVPSQTYHDLFASYQFSTLQTGSGGWRSGLLTGLQIQLGLQNVFDKEPPVDVANDFGHYSPFGDPRLASYTLTLRRSFQ